MTRSLILNNSRPWTVDECKYIRDHYLKQTDLQMAEVLNRTEYAGRMRRIKQGLLYEQRSKPAAKKLPPRYKGAPIDNGITEDLKFQVELMKREQTIAGGQTK